MNLIQDIAIALSDLLAERARLTERAESAEVRLAEAQNALSAVTHCLEAHIRERGSTYKADSTAIDQARRVMNTDSAEHRESVSP